MSSIAVSTDPNSLTRTIANAENGPYVLTKNGSVEERKYAWDVTSNIIFVDSPVNVGYSYSDDPRDRVFDEKTVAADLLDFLEEFYLGACCTAIRLSAVLAISWSLICGAQPLSLTLNFWQSYLGFSTEEEMPTRSPGGSHDAHRA